MVTLVTFNHINDLAGFKMVTEMVTGNLW